MILRTQGLSRRFGGLKAVDGVSFDAAENTVQSIIGPNGAGKTTFFNLVTGALQPDAGRILFEGRDVTGLGPDRLAEMGLVRTFQRTSIFREFTALENVSLAIRSRERRNQSLFLSRADERRIGEEAHAILAEVGLAGSEGTLANNLAHGSQRALDVAIGLASRPKLILMDEPLAGMSQGDRARIAALIVKLREKMGLAVVLVEHDIGMVMRLSDRITVLQHGQVIAAGTPAEIRENADVRAAYLRGSFAA
jgi:branched-chain amino acid transport system ATP-binding protein